MSPEAFVRWLAEMKAAGLAKSDAECGRLLGVSANAVVQMKKTGTDRRTDLACRALLHRMSPYGEK
jgi:DNA-binding CsgD family transcriptional regulator